MEFQLPSLHLQYLTMEFQNGQFIGSAPNFSSLQSRVATIWGNASKVKVSLADLGLFVFLFNNACDRDCVLEKGPWHIQNKPNMQKLDLDLTRIPVWLQLFNVPLELYTKKGLSYISSVIGTPLRMDSITASKERLGFAEVCVKIEAGAHIPRFVNVLMKDGSTVQIRILTPWIPPCCTYCRLYGHSTKTCTVMGDKTKTIQVWQVKKSDLTGNSDNSDDKTDLIASTGEQQSETGARAKPITQCTMSSPAFGVSNPVDKVPITQQANDIEFSSLPDSSSQKKGVKKAKKSGASTNKFEVLANDVDGRKPRAAAQGVIALLQDLKSKKKAHFDIASTEVPVSSGGGTSSKLSLC
ncbi:hypothetical protein V6N13_092070 [Hibiscus sabdariffa]